MKITSLLIISLAILFFSCSNVENNSSAKNDSINAKNIEQTADAYTGTYKTAEKGGCEMTITVSKENNNYKYSFKSENGEKTGNAIITKSDATYITFEDINGKNASVEGQVTETGIMIQNYGNAMNEYNHFPQCDQKYLEFKKL